MNVEIGAEAALFPGKEYINGIAVAVRGAMIPQSVPKICLILKFKNLCHTLATPILTI
jgi:hypothetical protein